MNRFFCFALLTVASAAAGCSSSGAAAGGVPVFPVSGTVTLFGSPLASATVAFAPEGEQPTAVGTTDAKGNFQLTTYEFGDGAAEGNYKVVISKAAVVAAGSGTTGSGAEHEVDEGDAHVAASDSEVESGQLVPQQYTSAASTPLRAEVKADGNRTFEFKIE